MYNAEQQTSEPITRPRLMGDLARLGVRPGMILLVHSSLSSLGWVHGGAQTVVEALLTLLTDEGTLVMPTHSGNYSDPANWSDPPVALPWRQMIYDAMPAFNPATTPSYHVGAIPEYFRTVPGTLRSNHPQVSFAARGRRAYEITAEHSLAYGLGEQSPLARVYELGGWVLLLGVGYNNNSSFHLAEYRSPGRTEVTLGSPVLEHGRRIWRHFADIDINAGVFPLLGRDFEKQCHVRTGRVGQADSRLFSQPLAVDFAVDWYKQRWRNYGR